MKILVSGSRDWPKEHMSIIDDAMIRVAEEHDGLVHVITGGARGVDKRADDVALSRPDIFTREVVMPDYKMYGLGAPLVRNIKMLELGPDLVLAFQYEGSSGTDHTIKEAMKRNIAVKVMRNP